MSLYTYQLISNGKEYMCIHFYCDYLSKPIVSIDLKTNQVYTREINPNFKVKNKIVELQEEIKNKFQANLVNGREPLTDLIYSPAQEQA